MAALVPIYLTGYPLTPEHISDPNRVFSLIMMMTFNNISGNTEKIKWSYLIIMVAYTVLSLGFILVYWKKSQKWKVAKTTQDSRFMEHDIALHSIVIKKLPL